SGQRQLSFASGYCSRALETGPPTGGGSCSGLVPMPAESRVESPTSRRSRHHDSCRLLLALWVRLPPRGTQPPRQLLLQHGAGLDEEAAIDRFVRYLHVLVGWELLLQPAGDLLRRPLQRELLSHAPS